MADKKTDTPAVEAPAAEDSAPVGFQRAGKETPPETPVGFDVVVEEK